MDLKLSLKKTVFCGLSVRGTDAARKKCENFPHLTNIGNNFLVKKFEDCLPFYQDFYPFHQYWFFGCKKFEEFCLFLVLGGDYDHHL